MNISRRFIVAFSVIALLGVASGGYILVQQRAPVPFQDTYRVVAEFTAADGVLAGTGQPVNVVGVKVGSVVGSEVEDGLARIALEIERQKLPRLYDNASAVIDPITPLEDMQVELDPGAPPGRPLPDGGIIDVNQNSSPVPVGDLLSTLDVDTRNYMSTMFASLRQGTEKSAPDLRRMLVALGPTTAHVGRITRALAERRKELARFVHNLSRVAEAATEDENLATLVSTGNTTLEAMARQEAPLQEAIAKLPSTLAVTRSTLARTRPFAHKLGPTLEHLLPAVDRLPRTFRRLRPFAETGSRALENDIRPLVREVQPLLSDLDPAVGNLKDVAPRLTRSLRASNYFLNVLAHNPEGEDEGGLFWLSWFLHNWNSLFSTVDAHGGIGRATVLVSCKSLVDVPELQVVFDLIGACPE